MKDTNYHTRKRRNIIRYIVPLLYWTKFSPKELASVQIDQKLVALSSAYKAGILASNQSSSQKGDTQNGGRLARIHSKGRAYHSNIRNGALPSQIIPQLAIKAQEKRESYSPQTPEEYHPRTLNKTLHCLTLCRNCSSQCQPDSIIRNKQIYILRDS